MLRCLTVVYWLGEQIAAELHCALMMIISEDVEIPGEGMSFGGVSLKMVILHTIVSYQAVRLKGIRVSSLGILMSRNVKPSSGLIDCWEMVALLTLTSCATE